MLSAIFSEIFGRTDRRYLFEANLSLSIFLLSIGGFGGEIIQIFSYSLFKLSPDQIGTLIGGLALWLPLSFLGAVVAKKLGSATVLAFGFAVRAILMGVLALIACFIPPNVPEFYWILLSLIWCLGANHSATFTSVWPAVVRTVTGDGGRARFISFMRLTLLASTIGALLLLGRLTEDGIGREHFVALWIILIISALWSLHRTWQLRAMHSGLQMEDGEAGNTRSIVSALRACLAHRPLLNLAAIALIVQLCKVPLLPVALMSQLTFDSDQAFWISATQQAALGVSLMLGALWLDKQDHLFVLRRALIFSSLASLLLFFLLNSAGSIVGQSAFTIVLPIVFVLGLGAGLAILALDIASFDAAPHDWIAPGLALYGMVFAFSDSLAQWLGGMLLDLSSSFHQNYYAIFILAGSIVTATLALRLYLPNAISSPTPKGAPAGNKRVS